MNEQLQQCGFCGHYGAPVFIYGHGACEVCKNNIDECCSGECEQTRIDEPKETNE